MIGSLVPARVQYILVLVDAIEEPFVLIGFTEIWSAGTGWNHWNVWQPGSLAVTYEVTTR